MEKKNGVYASFRQIEKITLIMNRRIEKRFEDSYDKLLKNHWLQTSKASFQFDKTQKKQQEDTLGRLSELNYNLSPIGLISAWQGNNEETYLKIARSGSLSPTELSKLGIKLTDSGYFGSGIYFSHFPNYCFQYSSGNSLLLSHILLGNVYPVHESVESYTLEGIPIAEKYDSHYVLVKRSGAVADVAALEKANGDEVVIKEGSQVLPRFIVTFAEPQKDCSMRYRNCKTILLWLYSDQESPLFIQWIIKFLSPTVHVEPFVNIESLCSWLKQNAKNNLGKINFVIVNPQDSYLEKIASVPMSNPRIQLKRKKRTF